jgi:hypothetical protein
MPLDVIVDPSEHPDEKNFPGPGSLPSNLWRGTTRTLREAGVMADWQVAESILERGSDVHKACHYRLQNDLDLRTLPNNEQGQYIRGCVRGLEKFLRETGFQVQKTEFPVENRRYGIRGRLDVAGILPNFSQRGPITPMTLIELMTGEPQPYRRLQLASYGFCLSETEVFRRIAVRLFPDGTYSVKAEYPVGEYFSDVHDFLACLRVINFKKRFKV